jgi:hypothetical protein
MYRGDKTGLLVVSQSTRFGFFLAWKRTKQVYLVIERKQDEPWYPRGANAFVSFLEKNKQGY